MGCGHFKTVMAVMTCLKYRSKGLIPRPVCLRPRTYEQKPHPHPAKPHRVLKQEIHSSTIAELRLLRTRTLTTMILEPEQHPSSVWSRRTGLTKSDSLTISEILKELNEPDTLSSMSGLHVYWLPAWRCCRAWVCPQSWVLLRRLGTR